MERRLLDDQVVCKAAIDKVNQKIRDLIAVREGLMKIMRDPSYSKIMLRCQSMTDRLREYGYLE